MTSQPIQSINRQNNHRKSINYQPTFLPLFISNFHVIINITVMGWRLSHSSTEEKVKPGTDMAITQFTPLSAAQ
jgi:hypothetical protein